MSEQPPRIPAWKKALGWAVHAYTGCGLLIAAWITMILMKPDRAVDDYRFCFLLMAIAMVIDATDGTFARLVNIKETVPEFDGRRLDDLVDFLMYTCLPLLLIDRAGILQPEWRWVLLVALAASGYGFSQSDVKTADGAFLGFPSYWNIIAFYLYALPVTEEAAAIAILGFAVLTFVPSRYPYPTQPGLVNRLMLLLSVPWAALVLICVVRHWHHQPPRGMIGLSAGYPTLYLVVAWGMSSWRWSQVK
ncbi:MAG TPA: CDP-alcohol phosphatidyltransferase [Gemmataceae bacterium]|jgi:phosphatidylcholine synthase|nr:CDP-alcohol phosphatidyltransferase [Gemmataceae bacterium]